MEPPSPAKAHEKRAAGYATAEAAVTRAGCSAPKDGPTCPAEAITETAKAGSTAPKTASDKAGRRTAEKSYTAKHGCFTDGAAQETGLPEAATTETVHEGGHVSQGYEAEVRSAEARYAAITTEKTGYVAI